MIFIEHIYNIGVLTVNIELMWPGLEPRERRALIESFQQFRAEPHQILYLPSIHQYCIYPVIKFNKKKCYLI